MDIKIWENTIVVWLNSLSTSSPINNINQINDSVLKEVVRKISLNSERSPVEFLKEVFQNLTESDTFKFTLGVEYLCASTLLLMYVSLCNREELNEIRELMCTKLDTSTQLNIVEFLNAVQEYEDVFNLSYKKLKQDIFPKIFFNFKEKHCLQSAAKGDGASTPIKNDISNNSFESPLQGFFQTPKRSVNKHGKCSYRMCGDGDYVTHIKKLTAQLVEEELEKTSLQEQLNIQTQKCVEFESKLKCKVEEINHLKEEWEKESKKNEDDMKSLKNKLADKVESEKKLKNELMHSEKYISKLELDVSDFGSKNHKLESQLKSALDKFTASEKQLKEASELCAKLQSTINDKEKELEQFREHYANFYNDEKAVDVSFMNGSLDKSLCSPENLGVVVDAMLREKIEENSTLQETIEELTAEKRKLLEEVNSLKEQLDEKRSVVSEIQFLNNELISKVEYFEQTEKELLKAQQDLARANAEISKLNKENSHLHEKYDILNGRLQQREQVLINNNHSKMLLQINFLKLAEDFKAAQQRLEFEVKNISRLALEKLEKRSKTEADVKLTAVGEGKDLKNGQKTKDFSNSERTLFGVKEEEEEAAFSKFDSLSTDEKHSKLSELLESFENSVEWADSKTSLQKTCKQLNDSIMLLKVKVREFEEHKRLFLETKAKFEKELKDAEEKMTKMESSNCSEIQRLTEELEEKEKKIKDLETAVRDFKKTNEELLLEKETVKGKEIKASDDERSAKVTREGGDQARAIAVFFDDAAVNSGKPKMAEPPGERQEFSDSLEEVTVVNKTFDIVNLEEKNISDKTFSIKKEDLEAFNRNMRSESAWVVSPPSKVPVKKPSREGAKSLDSRRVQGESWVVPVCPVKSKEMKVKKASSSVNDLRMRPEEVKITELQKEVIGLTKECDLLKIALTESEQKRRKDKECFERNQEIIRQNITAKYESQLEHLKSEMKQLYNRELAKHKQEQSSLNSELQDQNKRYKEHIDELRNQLWDLGEKLLQEQTLVRDLKRSYSELKEKYELLMFSKETDLKTLHVSDLPRQKETSVDETHRTSSFRQIPNVTFPTIPTEDEEEVFDNRFLEDMKMGVCKTERPEDRLKELQYRNSLCLPHLKSSYPGETQFHNPTLFKESDLKLGLLQFTQESQSLTDSDHSMTRSLLPDNKGKKKEQTSYKRPGPPTPSKNGGRLSIQSGDLRVTPRNALKELNEQNERNKGTPNPLKLLLTSKAMRRASVGGKDENSAPVTPRKKNFFRKPFGARDH